MPDGHADIIWFDDGRVEVAGLHDRLATPFLPAGTVARGVRLEPSAVGRVLGIDASEITNSTRRLDDFAIAERGALHDASVAAIDTWLAGARPDVLVAAAAEMLRRGTGVSAVAGHLGISVRQLERRFRTAAGLSPKRFQRVARLQRFLRLAATAADANLSTLAARAGYFDQSHLAREVRELTGTTPARGRS